MNNSLMKVNSEVYSNIVVKFGSTTKRPYKYFVKTEKGLQISIKPNVTNNSVVLVVNNNNVAISTIKYDHLVITIGNSMKRQLICDLSMKDNLEVVVYKGLINTKKVLRNNYQQDPTTMKKGKYRHRSKAF
jgi:hypothetical protein